MARVLETSTHLIDSAIGPVAVKTEIVEDYDIDDHVHSTVQAMAARLQFKTIAARADRELAKNRAPVDLDGVTVGGW